MYRKVAYSLGSLLMGGAALLFKPLPSKIPALSSIESTKSELSHQSSLDNLTGFPRLSPISVDPFGNIIIANKEHPDLVRGISPNGQLSPVLGSLHEADSYFASGYGAGQQGMSYGTGGGGYPVFNGGDLPSGSASAGGTLAQKLKDSPEGANGKAPYLSHVGENGGPPSFNSGGGGGGMGNSSGGFGLGGGSTPRSENSFASSPGSPLSVDPGAEKNLGEGSSSQPGSDALTSPASNQGSNLSIPSDLVQTNTKNDSNDSEPDFIPVVLPNENTEERSGNQNVASATQAPDRRNNAGNAEDAAKNAIPPILMNADNEKEKAKEEREKIPPNEPKAREHDRKAAALMAQAAAMAAAMAGNNNAKNKADSRDGEERPQQPLKIPDFTQPNSEKPSEGNPRIVLIPNPRKADRPVSSTQGNSPVNGNINPNQNPNQNIFIR